MIAVEAKERKRTCDLKILRVCCWVFLISLQFPSLKQCLNLKLGTVSHFMLQHVCKDIFEAYKYTGMTRKNIFLNYLWERSGEKGGKGEKRQTTPKQH